MTSRDFSYWLQGYLEISNPTTISHSELEVIKNNINLVFKHEIDPSINKGLSEEQIKQLDEIHSGSKPPIEQLTMRC